jgi:NAD+ kinase
VEDHDAVGAAGHPHRRRQSTAARPAVARDLLAAGFEVRVVAEEVADLELPAGVTPVDDPTAAEGVEIVFALGGDGTFLRAAELAPPAKAPLLGHQPRQGRLPWPRPS